MSLPRVKGKNNAKPKALMNYPRNPSQNPPPDIIQLTQAVNEKPIKYPGILKLKVPVRKNPVRKVNQLQQHNVANNLLQTVHLRIPTAHLVLVTKNSRANYHSRCPPRALTTTNFQPVTNYKSSNKITS